MNHCSSRPGFALLLVLVLVLLAGTLLAGVAWRSMVGALEAQDSAEELQRRWAVTSCRATLLGRVEKILDEAERGEGSDGDDGEHPAYANRPVPELRVRCQLAGIDYELVMTDEQAKWNVNRLLGQSKPERVRSSLARLMSRLGSGAADAKVTLRAIDLRGVASTQSSVHLEVGGYGQVFENASPGQLVGDSPMGGLASTITCWGPGTVNLRRAPAAVIEEACDSAIRKDVTDALIAARDRDPYRKISDIMVGLDKIDDKQRIRLGNVITDHSTCHGLWVIARGRQRSWYTLAVGLSTKGQGDDERVIVTKRIEFAW
jgi:type II secretory pathway component PulK